MAFYNITERYRQLNAIIESDPDGEGMAEAMEEAFNELMEDQAKGAEIAAAIIRNAEMLNAATLAEIARLKALVESRKSRIESSLIGVRRSMIATGTTSIETGLGVFKVRNGGERTEVVDEELLFNLALESEAVAAAVKVEVVRKPILTEIKRLLKSGEIAESVARLVRGDQTISFK